MQIVSVGDNLHEKSKSVFCENEKIISKCGLLNFLPRVLSVKEIMRMIVLSASYNMADIVYLYFLRLENTVISKKKKKKKNIYIYIYI